MSLTVSCPTCGADAVFRSPALPCRICDYCQTMLVRSDGGITAVGEAAVLPFDVSPVRIGMRGKADGHDFEVIGRVRWAWSDGAWNEWLLLFADGAHAWLGEAMGQFMLLRERPVATARARVLREVVNGGTAAPGTDAQFDGIKFSVADARDILCIAAEGELPFTAPPGWRVYSVDLKAPDGSCATLQRDRTESTFYVGRYVTLAELAPKDMRAIEGWTLPTYAR
ncbi:DUF4178 domain-containing protein [Sphingomonas sp. LT1P40]|uniref:DUF4178 domain-containing protein n=1 Tax=Alteristakelama amylovorans TaxID=3096166 RepID=UPI002FC68F36